MRINYFPEKAWVPNIPDTYEASKIEKQTFEFRRETGLSWIPDLLNTYSPFRLPDPGYAAAPPRLVNQQSNVLLIAQTGKPGACAVPMWKRFTGASGVQLGFLYVSRFVSQCFH